MTKTQRKVLQQAIDDGGTVVLSGIDKHRGWGQRECTAAAWLHAEGLGLYEGSSFPGAYYPTQFKIWPAGRRALDNDQE